VVYHLLNDPLFSARAPEEQIRAISIWLLNDRPPKRSINTQTLRYDDEYTREQYRSRLPRSYYVSSMILAPHGEMEWKLSVLLGRAVEQTRTWLLDVIKDLPSLICPLKVRLS